MSLEEIVDQNTDVDLNRVEEPKEVGVERPFYEATAGELSAGVETPKFCYNGERFYWTERNLNVFSKLIVLTLGLIEEKINLPDDERRAHLDHKFAPFDASLPREEALQRGAELQFRLCMVEFALLGNRPAWFPPPPGSVEGDRTAEASRTGVEGGLRVKKKKLTGTPHHSGLREASQISGTFGANQHHQGQPHGMGMRESLGQGLGYDRSVEAGRLLRRRSYMRAALNADGTPRRSYANTKAYRERHENYRRLWREWKSQKEDKAVGSLNDDALCIVRDPNTGIARIAKENRRGASAGSVDSRLNPTSNPTDGNFIPKSKAPKPTKAEGRPAVKRRPDDLAWSPLDGYVDEIDDMVDALLDGTVDFDGLQSILGEEWGGEDTGTEEEEEGREYQQDANGKTPMDEPGV